MRLWRMLLLALVATALAIGMAACGDDEEETGGGGETGGQVEAPAGSSVAKI